MLRKPAKMVWVRLGDSVGGRKDLARGGESRQIEGMKEMPDAKTLQQKIEETMSRVCQMPRGGDLEGLLIQEVEELKTLLQAEALRRREAAFPPCGGDGSVSQSL
jgi:hypothetical protein